MTPPKPILVAAGDVGGARAILPALYVLAERQRAVVLLDHGFIAGEAPCGWPRTTAVSIWGRRLSEKFSGLVFGTSVSDPLPLQIARQARVDELPVVCVLDNWMNYRRRLEMDGQTMLVPEAYAIMDELAREEAIADGVPGACLRVVGQPSLATLGPEFLSSQATQLRPADGRKLIVFISEPAEADQGADERNPRFRGYTEKTVLVLLAHRLQPFASVVSVGLVPHPREDASTLLAHWEACRGKLDGGRLATPTGREAVFMADGVCGMSSLLLYEALLLGKPVLSLQPGLRLPQLGFLQRKGVEFFETDPQAANRTITSWLGRVLDARNQADPTRFHPDLELHRNAADTLASLIEELSAKPTCVQIS